MKKTKIEEVAGSILKDGQITDDHLASLNRREWSRVLMKIVNHALYNADWPLLAVAVQRLSMEDEEVLVLASAAVGCGNAWLVPKIVERFCKNTKIARRELYRAGEALLHNKGGVAGIAVSLTIVIDCIRLYDGKFTNVQGELIGDIPARFASEVLKLAHEKCNETTRLIITQHLQDLIDNSATWKKFEEITIPRVDVKKKGP